MQKDFDEWNKRKKYIHTELANPPYLERDIWWCSLGINIGYEEDGDGINSERPAVIIRGFSKELCWIVPLTTSLKNNKYYIKVGTINEKQAQAMITQMRPIDTKRFINKIGFMDRNNFNILEKAIRDLLK